MKTLILYATKNGAAAEIATRISMKIEGAVTQNLKDDAALNFADYDCIVVGSAIYAGGFRREAKAFLNNNAAVLKSKKLGLFASGMAKEEEQKVFADNISKDILTSARVAMLLGGIFDPAKSGLMARAIMKAVTKQSGYVNTIDDEKIAEFAKIMQG